jgi:hypothetical protein
MLSERCAAGGAALATGEVQQEKSVRVAEVQAGG